MHTVVIRREILERDPLGRIELLQGALPGQGLFVSSDHGDRLAKGVARPGCSRCSRRSRAIIGPDWYPYGIEKNRPSIEALLQYAHEQGLTARLVKTEELFATLDAARQSRSPRGNLV